MLVPLYLNLDSGGSPPVVTSGFPSGMGGGGTGLGRQRSKLDKRLNELLDTVSAEVMYKDLAKTSDAPAAAKIVKPFSDDRQKAVPMAVNWPSLEADANRVAQLLALWTKHQQRLSELRKQEEDWFLLGD